MHKKFLFPVFLQALSLCCVAVWWIFFLMWRPATLAFIQSISYKFEEPNFSAEVVSFATQRSYEYVTRGTILKQDIIFTPAEISHLLDVHQVYLYLRIMIGIFALMSWIILLSVLIREHQISRHALFIARDMMLALVGLISLSLLVFPIFFSTFHGILFPQGNWTFSETSVLVQIFPDTFWRLALGLVLVLTALFVFFFNFVGKHYSHD